MHIFGWVFFSLLSSVCLAQQGLIYVKLDSWAKDERFDKYELISPLYIITGDTIESNDFENLRDSKLIPIKKPDGYKSYAYGSFFFNGVPNPINPGFTSFLVVNHHERNPKLFIDRNNNYDFNDDGMPVSLMMPFNYSDSVIVELKRDDNPDAGTAIKLSRMNLSNKYSYRKMLNDYYSFFYPNRKFAGVEYSFREQRYTARSGVVRYGSDSFRVALYDANTNGWYNDIDTDKVITANIADSAFDSKDVLRAFTITKKREEMFIEKDGEQFEIIQIDPAGKFMILKSVQDTLLMGRIEQGKKIPKFHFMDWQGKKFKIKKFRRNNVFIYFTGPNAKNFKQDTADLRMLAELDPKNVKVIAFIDVNKSYELKIFGTYSNLNWIAAFKDKKINQALKVRGLPSSLWIGKRRRLLRYNLTPRQFMELYTTKDLAN